MLKYSLIIAIVLFPQLGAAGELSITLNPGDSATRFFSGEVIDRVIQVEGLPETGGVILYWKTLVGPAVIETGEVEVKRGENNTGIAEVRLSLPEVKRRAGLVWLVELVSEGKILKKEAIQYRLFPRTNPGALKDILRNKNVGIFDPRGKLKKLFQVGELNHEDIANQLALKNFNGDLLLIGPGAIDTPYSGVFDIVDKMGPETGVVCFRQTVLPREMPFPLELLTGVEAVNEGGIIMAPGHPIFSDLDEDDFRGWRGYPAAFSPPMNKPFWGNYRSLMDLSLAGKEKEKKGSLLLEAFPAGKKMIFCQVPVCDTIRSEPVAGILFENLIRYSLLPLEETGEAAVLSPPGGVIGDFFVKLGLVARSNPVDLTRFDRIVLIYNRESKEYISREGVNLLTCLEEVLGRGGKILILGLEPDTIGSLDRIMPEGLRLDKMIAPVREGVVKRDSPIFWGIADCEWTECVGEEEEEEFFEDKPVYEIVSVSGKKGRPLTAPPFIYQPSSREGTIIICQWPFFRQEKDKDSLRIFCQFLTNLGFRLKKNEKFLQEFER